MDTPAAAYRLVSAACNLPFCDLKYNSLVRHLQPDISVFEWLVTILHENSRLPDVILNSDYA